MLISEAKEIHDSDINTCSIDDAYLAIPTMEGIDASADCVRPTQDLAIRGLDGTKREHCLEGVLDIHEDSCAFNLLERS